MAYSQASATSTRSTPSSARTPVTAVQALIMAGMICGQLQGPITLLIPSLGFFNYVDDTLLVFAFLAAVPRLSRAPGVPLLIAAAWTAALSFSAFYAIEVNRFPPSNILFMFRQVTLPAMLLVVGLVLTRTEWRAVIRLLIAIGLINVVYAAIEMVFGRPIDPVAIAAAKNKYIGYYSGNDILTGHRITRAGGLLLNPPSMGMFFAASLAAAVYFAAVRHRALVVSALAVGLYLTGSRGGLLAAVIAVCVPWAAARINAWVTIGLIGLAATPVGIFVAEQAGSSRHAKGLVRGFLDAYQHPLGRGLGFVGNFRPKTVVGGVGESLWGIPFSAVGMFAVLVITVAAIQYLRLTNSPLPERRWISALALGGVVAALFAETAASIDATVPIWLASGIALGYWWNAKPNEPRPDSPRPTSV